MCGLVVRRVGAMVELENDAALERGMQALRKEGVEAAVWIASAKESSRDQLQRERSGATKGKTQMIGTTTDLQKWQGNRNNVGRDRPKKEGL